MGKFLVVLIFVVCFAFLIKENKKKKALAHKEKVDKIVNDFNIDKNLMESSDSVLLFVNFFDEAIENLKELEKMGENPKSISYPTSMYIHKLNDEFQWHLCDAIARERDTAISEIRTKYINSKEFQRKCAYKFYDEVKKYIDRFSKDSLELADEALREVFRVARADYVVPIVEREAEEDGDDDVEEFDDPVDRELRKIDFMEGHEFEYWCAELLK